MQEAVKKEQKAAKLPQKPIQVQKHVVKASGVVAGGIDGYNANSYYAFCDPETLKQLLKKGIFRQSNSGTAADEKTGTYE